LNNGAHVTIGECKVMAGVRVGAGVLATLLVASVLSGCGGLLEGKKIDYKSAGKLPPLEVPPDLAAPPTGSRYAVPDAEQKSTFSQYEQTRGAPAASTAPATVLPPIERVQMQRGGIQRWLVVKAPPDAVWPMVKDFWQENGFLIDSEDVRAGWMETDWAENRAKIAVGGLTGLINKALDGMVSLPERDKFRTRLERGADGVTEVYVSHKGMAEVYVRERDNDTRWQVRPSDTELEALMLSRLAQRMGLDEAQAKAVARAADVVPPQASLVASGDGAAVALPDAFDRAWRRVGLALDRVGFMVEDRNRADGVYFVKYQDPDAAPIKRSGVSRLAFWRSDEKPGPVQYRVRVAGQPGGGSEVRVLGKEGAPEKSDTAKRILALLVEQLK
jgi:outer membrane protein assembly factor BamC